MPGAEREREELPPERTETWSWLASASRSAVIRFVVGVGAFVLLEQGAGAVRQAIRSRKRARRPVLAQSFARTINADWILTLVKRSFLNRRALRLGAWAASFGLAYSATKRISGSSQMAGAAAGATIAVLGPLRGTFADPVEFALHSAVRAAEQVLREAGGRGLLPKQLAENGATLVFVAACTQIMFCWFYEPEALPRSYRLWITKMADMDARLITALRLLRSGRVRYGKYSPVLRSYCEEHHLDPRRADLVHGHIPCCLVHPASGESCLHNCVSRAAGGAVAAMLLYVPVHAAGVALRTGRQIAAMPAREASPERVAEIVGSALQRVAVGASRSSAFLGCFIGLVWYGVCLTRGALRSDLTLGPLFGSFLCGWTILLEPPHRRADLAMFVLPRAIHAAWFSLKKTAPRLFADVPFFNILLAAASGAVLVPAWERDQAGRGTRRHDGSIQPLVALVLWLLLGNPASA